MDHARYITGTWLAWAILVFAGSASIAFAQGVGDAEMDWAPGERIAVQLYTLRQVGSFDDQLGLAAASGYAAVESLGTHGLSAGAFREHLDRHGLQIASSHVQLSELRRDLDAVVDFHQAVGNDVIVVPILLGADRPTDIASWQEMGRELDALGARLRENGLRLAYHNHDYEMRPLDGRPALDWMFDETNPANVGWQADVAWIDRGGQDPAEMLRRHANRLVSIHAKDNAPAGTNLDEDGFADVGSGVLQWESIMEAAHDAGAEWWIVEHDQPSDPRRTLEQSLAYLTELAESLDPASD